MSLLALAALPTVGAPLFGQSVTAGTDAGPDLAAFDRRPVATYSIVARDPDTGELGVAVQSHWFSVGPIVPFAEAGVGAVATQSFVDPSYGPLGLELMSVPPRALSAAPSSVPGPERWSGSSSDRCRTVNAGWRSIGRLGRVEAPLSDNAGAPRTRPCRARQTPTPCLRHELPPSVVP